jgi:ornithine cyclodeaminase/alanine dehydrogenase-like protein (mu-crystallin family)
MVSKDRQTRVLFVAVGAYRADMAELSSEIVSRAEGSIVVDTVEGAMHEAGDLLAAGIRASQMIGLENIDETQLRGKVHVFKSVGNALWDLAAARVAVSG